MTSRPYWIERFREGSPGLTNVVLCFFGFALVWLARQFGMEEGRFWIGFEDVALLSAMMFLVSVLLVWTQPVNRTTLWIVVWFAVAMHAMTFLVDPFLSSDMYRYVWDGMVQHHGISPYRYVPGDPVLAALRAPNQEIFDNINRRDYARTIYPPVAQIVYWAATWFAPTVDALKLAMLGFEALAAWMLVRLLGRLGRPPAEVVALLWCPMLVWEIGDAAHVDAVVIGFMGMAMFFRAAAGSGAPKRTSHQRWAQWATGFFLGCAVMTKFYPIVLFPALWQRRDWRMPTALVSVVLVGYGLYARVGRLVFGFLFTGYTKEEGMESGTRYFPLDFARTRLGLMGLPNAAFYLLCLVALGSVVWWCWQHATTERPPLLDAVRPVPGHMWAPAYLRGAGWLAFAMMLLFSPHYPWYVIWLVPFLVLAPSLPMFTYVLGLWFGLTTALAEPGPKMFLMNERLYLAVGVAFVLEQLHRRWPVWPWLVSRNRIEVSPIAASARVVVQ